MGVIGYGNFASVLSTVALVGIHLFPPLPLCLLVCFLRSCDVLHDWSITGGQQAQPLSLYLALVSLRYGWWPILSFSFFLCL